MTATPEFPISLADLDAGGREFTFPVRAAWIRSALEGTDASTAGTDGKLDVRVSKSGTDVVVRGHLVADLHMTCGRCLEPVTLHVDQPLTALMVPASELKASSKEYEPTPEEMDVMTYSGDSVALDDVVRDELVLEIPMIPLCSEDCTGITPPPPHASGTQTAAEKLGIDPRLAPLLRLKNLPNKD